ncbi:MAG: hypothetical protein JNK78_19225 [Planctomycetes bacterium]|nr:hypothetical protein [Planctomycetota bacterium]
MVVAWVVSYLRLSTRGVGEALGFATGLRGRQFGMSMTGRTGLVGMLAVASVAAQAESRLSVAQLLPFVERQERAVPFVRGRGVCYSTAEQRGDRVRIGEHDVGFVREVRPAGRSLLDYALDVARSEDGKYYRESRILGYDGSTSWLLTRTLMVEGRDSEPIPLLRGQVSAMRNPHHAAAWATGWPATLPGFYDFQGRRFSDALRESGAPFRLRTQGDLVVLSLDGRSGEILEEWTLRPEWNYGLCRFERIVLAGRRVERSFSVESAEQVHADLWYPKAVRYEAANESGWKNVEMIVEVKEVSAASDVKDEVFKPSFPHGSVVFDVATKETSVVSARDEDLDRALSSQGADLRSRVDFARPRASWWHWSVVLGCASLVIVVWMRWLRTRRAKAVPKDVRSSGGICLVLFAAVLGAPSTAQDRQSWLVERVGQKVDNCGVDAVVVVAAYYARTLPAEGVASRLGVGSSRARAADLQAIKDLLTEESFVVSAFQGATLEQVRRVAMDRHAVAVLHCRGSGSDGHFMVIGPSKEGVVLCDPGRLIAECVAGDKAWTRLEKRLSGVGLMVAAPENEPAAWPIAHQSTFEVRCPPVGSGRREVVVPVDRTGWQGWALEGFESGCGCVRDVRVQGDELRLEVDSARLSTDATKTVVRLNCRVDGVLHLRILDLFVRRTEADAPLAPCVVPSLVHPLGRSNGKAYAFVEVVVPNGGGLARWKGDEGVEVSGSTLRAIPGGVAWRQKIEWPAAAARVEFLVSNAEGSCVPVHCYLSGDELAR